MSFKKLILFGLLSLVLMIMGKSWKKTIVFYLLLLILASLCLLRRFACIF